MTIVTKESFRDWKANPVTKAVFNDIYNRIHRIQEELGATAGLDPLNDRFRVGAIGAYNDLLNIEVDEVSNGD
jgi:hypothetical protein